jgi:hypothetical protein
MRPSNSKAERTLSEGKMRRGQRKEAAVASFERPFQVTPLKEVPANVLL